jgi:hypothetical protein
MHSITKWKRLNVTIILVFILIPLTVSHAKEWSLPEALVDKIAGLEPHQQAFINSGDALKFLPERQLIHEIKTRDIEAIQTLLNDVMAVAAQMTYDPTRDMGAIPLNLSNDYFNYLIVTPAPLRKLKRKEGPFSTDRYMFPTSGISTFTGEKVATCPEDLVAGNVDVAIIGIPSDMSSGRRNAEYAPDICEQ